jgi:dynein heavy chain
MLDRMLQRISIVWTTTDFRLVPHSSGSVVIIAGIDEMQALLEESQMMLGTIRGSRYAAPFKVELHVR